MSHAEFVDALRSVEGLRDVGRSHPNFHFRSRPFLHFHIDDDDRMYADVRFGGGDFEERWADTPQARAVLFAEVADHVESLTRTRKTRRSRL